LSDQFNFIRVNMLHMTDDSSINSKQPIIDFNNPKVSPAILTIGVVLWRVIAWWANIDFILSIREEKIAMSLQLLLDWGWLALMIVGGIWILGAHKTPADITKVHWGMVAAVGILSFMYGTLVTVHAIGVAPNVLTAWGGDTQAKTCSSQVDTSRLIGLKDKDKIITLCGVADPTRDPMEDDKIAVSRPFTITGQPTVIVAQYGAMAGAVSELPQVQGAAFMLWHSVALIPRDVDASEIKRVTDVAKRGGKVLTDPQAGAFGSPQAVITIVPPQPLLGK
jgi:hypothetical protein